MNKVLFITSSFIKCGNGDILIETAMQAANEAGAIVSRVDLRDKRINHCRGCNTCMAMTICVHNDDMESILETMSHSNSIIIAMPIMFNMPNGLITTFFDRCNMLLNRRNFSISNVNWKVGAMVTMGRTSFEQDMANIVENFLVCSDRIEECRIEVFSNLLTKETTTDPRHIEIAKDLGKWAAKVH